MAGNVRASYQRWRQWWRDLPIWPARGLEAADLLALQQLEGVMGAAMHRLSPEQQQFLALRFGRGFSVAQIARVSHRAKAEVRMDQLLTLRALQHELESHAS